MSAMQDAIVPASSARLEPDSDTNVTSHGALPQMPFPVTLTERAAAQVRLAMAQEGLSDHGLRVGVVGGGCSGLQYMLDFSATHSSADFVQRQHDISVMIDPFSAAFLAGTVIDYIDGLSEAGFKFENPNVVRACGCGSSFQA